MIKIMLVLLLLLSGCAGLTDLEVETPIVIDEGIVLPENICKSLNEPIIIHKTGCPACAVAIPIIQELEKELGKEFIYYNVAVEEERNELMALGFVPRYVPTIVVDCKVHTGALSREEFRELLK